MSRGVVWRGVAWRRAGSGAAWWRAWSGRQSVCACVFVCVCVCVCVCVRVCVFGEPPRECMRLVCGVRTLPLAPENRKPGPPTPIRRPCPSACRASRSAALLRAQLEGISPAGSAAAAAAAAAVAPDESAGGAEGAAAAAATACALRSENLQQACNVLGSQLGSLHRGLLQLRKSQPEMWEVLRPHLPPQIQHTSMSLVRVCGRRFAAVLGRKEEEGRGWGYPLRMTPQT